MSDLDLCPTCTFPKGWDVHDQCADTDEDLGERHTDPAVAVPEDVGQDKYEHAWIRG